ncbi:jg13395 [Pararge aegeria aegeria]|uniref:Jg13395 protein n=1 Tax=Pararge aegeria aegeria TaxID=348720 RepID=A0A8S4RBH3_9NEOP|nr:jg13395 [Pararge aegeria aegeria]
MHKLVIIFTLFGIVAGWPQIFATKSFKIGIEYHGSLPIGGGSERYRHRNNLDPFFITVTANAKNGYVISYLQVTTTTDLIGNVEFNVVRGQTGSKSIVFQLITNQTDFLSYNYLVYGIREEEYKKVSNIITIQMRNSSGRHYRNLFMKFVFIAISLRCILT